MLALASLAMSLILKFLEIALKTRAGQIGVGGAAFGLGGLTLGWAAMKFSELWLLHKEVCSDDKQGFMLFSWLSPSTIAKSHENVMRWLKLQDLDIQKQYRDALAV